MRHQQSETSKALIMIIGKAIKLGMQHFTSAFMHDMENLEFVVFVEQQNQNIMIMQT